MENPRWSRRDFLRRSMLTSGLVVAPSFLVACAEDSGGGGSTLANLQESGTITVGIAGEEPYGFLEGGELTGAAPAVHKAIWQAVGIENVNAEQVDFSGLIPGLNAGRFDTVSAGMFITPERCEQAQFSDPVYCAPNAFIVPEGNPDNISDFKSVADAGIKLAVLSGAVEGGYATSNGVDQGNIVQVGGVRDGILQVQQGRVGALGLTSITLKNALKDFEGGGVEMTEPFTPTVDGEEQLGCGAAVFRPEDDELVAAFNEELAKLKESGELVSLMEPFGFGEETVPPEDVTTEMLCGGGS